MRSWSFAPAVVALLSAGLLLLAAPGMGGSRMDTELSWDDGTAEGEITSRPGQKLAVGFYAPETALLVTGIRVYIMDDGVEHPTNPGQPTTSPFTVWLWSTTGDGQPGPPANDGYVPFTAYGLCPEDTWVDLVFPDPIDVSDEGQFPNHKFHVGVEWEHRHNPILGLDLDPPSSGETRYWDWSTWVLVDTVDAMVRAVVRDTCAAPVEVESWGRVKSEYR